MQILILLDSRLGNMKQVLNDAWMSVWNQDFSSTQLEFAEISRCHEHAQASTVAIFKNFPRFFFNRSPTTPVDDDQHKQKQKESRISMEKLKNV